MEAHTDDDRRARIDVTLEINDLKHLDKVITSLRGVEGVLDVERAGRVRGRARLVFRFTEATVHGQKEPLRTNPLTFEAEATRKQDAAKIGAGAIGGAIVGAIAGGGDDVARFPAVAIECVHTYSLVHDDLPCMDDSDLRRGRPSCHKAFDEATALLAGDALQPLAFEPGTKWAYSNPGINTLGRIVEVVSGQGFAEFLDTRLFRPLGMKDTYFFLPRGKRERLTAVYTTDSTGRVRRAPDGAKGQGHYVDGPRANYSGGAGLVSTAFDYAKFLECIRSGGATGNVRILAPASVRLMTNNMHKYGGLEGYGLEIVDRVPLQPNRMVRDHMERTASIKHTFTAEDIYARASKTLEQCLLHGVTHMRTQVEVDPNVGLLGFEAIEQLRKDYAWAIDLESCVFLQEGWTDVPGADENLVTCLKRGARVIGGGIRYDKDGPGQIRRVFELAQEYDIDVDFHLDGGFDVKQLDYPQVCEITDKIGWQGRVAFGHGSKFSFMPVKEQAAVQWAGFEEIEAQDLSQRPKHSFEKDLGVNLRVNPAEVRRAPIGDGVEFCSLSVKGHVQEQSGAALGVPGAYHDPMLEEFAS